VRSKIDFSVEDHKTTQFKRDEAAREILPVYDHDNDGTLAFYDKLTQMSDGLKLHYEKWTTERAKISTSIPTSIAALSPTISPVPSSAATEAISPVAEATVEDKAPVMSLEEFISAEVRWVRERLGWEISDVQMTAIVGSDFVGGLSRILQVFQKDIVRARITADSRMMEMESSPSIIVRDLANDSEQKIDKPYGFLNIDDAREIMATAVRNAYSDGSPAVDFLTTLIELELRPNLYPNMDETNRRRQKARDSVSPVFFQVRHGEMLVRYGDRLTPETILKLTRLNELLSHRQQHSKFIGNIALITVMLFVTYLALGAFSRRHKQEFESLVLVGVVLLGSALTNRFFVMIGTSLANAASRYPYDQLAPYYYALPVAAGALLITLLVNPTVAILVSVVAAVHTGLMTGESLSMAVFSFLASLSGVLGATKYRQRSVVLYAGMLVALTSIVSVVGFNLRSGILSLEISFGIMCALIGGILTTMVAMVLLPVLESLFNITTDIRLLELSSSEQPLLKKLALTAPGTYHHSLIVGALAESAAECIGANGLLAKVASYYHDIGKVEKADYYSENQTDGSNPHDKLGSNLSKLVLISHVKSGVELAVKHRLGREIVDIVAQHHGNSLIRYFFVKAKQAEEHPDVSEDSFRYPGPRPRTKEAAIVMLSDCVEAASRSLHGVHPGAIRTLVEKIVEEKFLDNQFDDCDLTFRDLNLIKDSLLETLLKYRHQRIAYPELKPEVRKGNGDESGTSPKEVPLE